MEQQIRLGFKIKSSSTYFRNFFVLINFQKSFLSNKKALQQNAKGLEMSGSP